MSMQSRAVVAAGLFLFLATPAAADDGYVLSTSVQPSFGDGKLEGCQTVFTLLHRDPEYFGNEMVLLSGSVLISAYPGKVPALTIKLGVAKAEGAAALQFQAPTNAYLVDGLKTNIGDKLTQAAAETPGHALFLYKLDPDSLDALTPFLRDGKMTIAYAMNNGSMGSRFVLDDSIADTHDGRQIRDETAIRRFQDCFWTVMKPFIDVAK